MNREIIESLSEELLRAVTAPDFRGKVPKFTRHDGDAIEGQTESFVIKHLTAKRSPVKGRQFRFPGISTDFFFNDYIEAAGFEFVEARNERGQKCRVLVIK